MKTTRDVLRGGSSSWARLILLGVAFFLMGFGFTAFQGDADAQLVPGHRNTPYPSQGIIFSVDARRGWVDADL